MTKRQRQREKECSIARRNMHLRIAGRKRKFPEFAKTRDLYSLIGEAVIRGINFGADSSGGLGDFAKEELRREIMLALCEDFKILKGVKKNGTLH